MASALICAKCGNKIIGTGLKRLGKLYCRACYEQVIAEYDEQEKAKEELYTYIRQLFNISEIPSEVVNVIDYNLKNGKKINGIGSTLKYYFEYSDTYHEADSAALSMLGKIIRENYDKAREWGAQRNQVLAYNETVDLNVPPVTVKIERPKNKSKIKYRMEDL